MRRLFNTSNESYSQTTVKYDRKYSRQVEVEWVEYSDIMNRVYKTAFMLLKIVNV